MRARSYVLPRAGSGGAACNGETRVVRRESRDAQLQHAIEIAVGDISRVESVTPRIHHGDDGGIDMLSSEVNDLRLHQLDERPGAEKVNVPRQPLFDGWREHSDPSAGQTPADHRQ